MKPIPEKLIKKFLSLRAERDRLGVEQEKLGHSILRRLLKEEIDRGDVTDFVSKGAVAQHVAKYHLELKPTKRFDIDNWGFDVVTSLENGE